MDTEKTSWESFFDGHAPEYMQNVFTKNTIFEVDFLTEELGLDTSAEVLDVGCGTGRHAIELARRGHSVTGLDLSTGMLSEAEKGAKAAGVEVTWVHGDATSFSLDRRFDAAICLCEGAFGLLGACDEAIGQPISILRNVVGALKPGGKCLFTVLNGIAMLRRQAQEDVEQGRFDPIALTEIFECSAPDDSGPLSMRERGFVPTELALLFSLSGLEILSMWGGTAGNWGRRDIDLDEIEIMIVARKPAE